MVSFPGKVNHGVSPFRFGQARSCSRTGINIGIVFSGIFVDGWLVGHTGLDGTCVGKLRALQVSLTGFLLLMDYLLALACHLTAMI